MLSKFRKNIDGNVAMMFGIVATVLVGGTALALDGSRLLSLKAGLQDITDAAALAGAYVADTDRNNREDVVREAVEFHLASIGSTVNVRDIRIVFDDATEELTVSIDTQQDLVLAGFLSGTMGDVSSETVASYAIENEQPVSMAFVLDVSGSMNDPTSNGSTRLEVVKQASNDLFGAIEDAVTRPEVLRGQVRTGMTAYNIDLRPEYTVPIQNGWDGAAAGGDGVPDLFGGLDPVSAASAGGDSTATLSNFGTFATIQNLKAGGGTNSSSAFEASYLMLNQEPDREGLRKFIIFMTDGSNNENEYDEDTIEFCDIAKKEGMRIFTVAFEAPQRGLDLLEECASTPKVDNFFDASNADDFRAAFREIGASIGELNTRITR